MPLINVTLPDGTVNEYASGITCAEVITDALGRKHGCLAARVDGDECDMSTPLEQNCSVEGILSTSDEGIHILRHSAAHLLAQAVTALYPGAKPTIGPAIDRGFYYDFAMEAITESDLKPIQKKMQELARKNFTVERVELSESELQDHFADNPYKLEIINDKIEDGGGSTIYKQDEWYDLCLGPHVPNTSRLMHVKLTSVSSAYWRGDQDREQLVRIYGIVEPSKEALRATLTRLEEAKKRDHRKLGKDLKLFHIDEEVGQGLILWTPRGAVIRQELQDFISFHLRRQGYSQVFTPHVGKLDLYRTSGHFPYYQDSQYPPLVERDLMKKLADEGCTCGELSNLMKLGDIDGYMLKPMNCPHHVKIYASQQRSYRDLPLRLAEFGTVYRYEQSGELHGLTRVRGFTQDDAHIFCMREQVKAEFGKVIDLVLYVFNALGFEDFTAQISLRDPNNKQKYIGADEDWDSAEAAIIEVANAKGLNTVTELGEAAFYGPKLDFMVRDAIGRKWQLGTIQVDYQLPERFQLEYIGADNAKHRPVMIHRAPFGSMERFIAVLIEHCGGNFPLWLSPEQIAVLPISEKYQDYAQEVYSFFEENNIVGYLDHRDEKIGRKIRDAEMKKVPYMIIIGEKEEGEQKISVRKHGEGDLGTLTIQEFKDIFEKEVNNAIKV